MDRYQRGLALHDNPFRPYRRIGEVATGALQDLDRRPLQIDRYPELLELFSRKAGPFESILDGFLKSIGKRGYVPGEVTDATQSMIFLVSGPIGSGKSTVVNAMINQVKQIRLREPLKWAVIPERAEGRFGSSDEQVNHINGLKNRADKTLPAGDGYCCLKVDNLMEGAEAEALSLFDSLVQDDRVVLMFLTTNDDSLLNTSHGDSPYNIESFKCDYVTPEQAVAFVRHRIRRSREKHVQVSGVKLPRWIDDHPLFPFVEKDVETAVLAGLLTSESRKGKVTLRELGSSLARFLDQWLDDHADDFDIANIPAGEVNEHMISMLDAYRMATTKKAA